MDFFISYRGARADWARWVNWVVRSAGFSTILMDDFPVGTTWTGQMRDAAQRCRRLIPLYSDDYWVSGACREEFDAYWRQHLQNDAARFLLPLVVEKCTVPDMHSALLTARLYDRDRDAAFEAVVKVLQGITPVTPGPAANAGMEPAFPGHAKRAVAAADWPDAVPALRWPLADHNDAREAFATLVTRSSPFRLLAVKGDSETGKTHLTRQFLTNALRRVAGCTCGRFDFKGAGDLNASMSEFADQLQAAPPPENQGLAAQFSALLRALGQGQRPTLFIFDTYESAGESDRWVRESLLTGLLRTPWLRVVLAGQQVPACHGQPWEEDALLINLNPPSPDHWHAWSVENKRAISLDFVRQAHALCRGKASTLASLFGPTG